METTSSSEDSIVTNPEETAAGIPVPTEKPSFNLGMMLVAYANENDDKTIRHIQVDMKPLAAMAEREGFTREEYLQRVQGFSDALDLVLKNYNVSPKTTPLSQEDWEEIQDVFQSTLREHYKQLQPSPAAL